MSWEPIHHESLQRGGILSGSVLGWAAALLVAIAGALSVKHLGLPNMAAAQVTVGLFGLAGGASQVLIVRKTGAELGRKKELFLCLVWGLSCIGGVTPLFFTTGTLVKMAFLAFYSFGVFGAVGGSITARVVRSRPGKAPTFDAMPAVMMWAFSFGLAAVTGNAVGEGLGKILPTWISWPLALLVTALVIGGGGGYALLHLLDGRTPKRGGSERPSKETGLSAETERKDQILLLLLLLLPFYLNDFANIYIQDWRLWLLIDFWAVKLFPCLVVLWAIRSKKTAPAQLGLTAQPLVPFATVFVVGTLGGTFIDQNVPLALNHLQGYPALGRMPEIKSPLWNWMDLTFGLLMVGIVEELVFRGWLYAFLTRYTRHPLVIIGISSVAFGLIHWSGGFHWVVMASAVGALFMILYMRTRSLPAVMLAHFAVDFIDFAKVIPREIFRFF